MPFRFKAFGLHLLGSASALTLILGGLYLGWYRWPAWYLTGVLRVFATVGLVDLVLGPLLTLIIANPRKPRRELARDIAMIVAVQTVALVYGAGALWQGRPLYYTFSGGILEVVQASALHDTEISRARKENPALAPYWYSLPRWVWAPLPDDPDEAVKIVNGKLFGDGQDVTDMPRYFKPWHEGFPRLRDSLSRIDDMPKLSQPQKARLKSRMTSRGLSADEANAVIWWATDGMKRLVVIFDRETLVVRAILKPD